MYTPLHCAKYPPTYVRKPREIFSKVQKLLLTWDACFAIHYENMYLKYTYFFSLQVNLDERTKLNLPDKSSQVCSDGIWSMNECTNSNHIYPKGGNFFPSHSSFFFPTIPTVWISFFSYASQPETFVAYALVQRILTS